MQFFLTTFILAIPAVHAAVGGHCTPAGGANSRSICVSTAVCRKYGGTYVNNKCPNDPADIKCCSVDNCLDSSSFCTWTGKITLHEMIVLNADHVITGSGNVRPLSFF